MNLKSISNEKLLRSTERIALQERARTVDLLHHLKEIDRRRLYSDLKYPSLYVYVVKHLKYSEDQAYRRIAAARLLAEVPEIAVPIAAGDLTLTNVGVAQQLFSRERRAGRTFTKFKKREFLSKLEGMSSRDAERTAAELSPPQSVIQLMINISKQTEDKLTQLKGLMAHSHPGITTEQLIGVLCDIQLAKLNKRRSPAAPRVNAHQVSNKIEKSLSWSALRRAVWKRDHGKCVNCHSQYALEVDHITPRAMGGGDTLENLRLLCRNCNQRAAIKYYGAPKMKKYIRSPIRPYKVN